MNNLNLAKELKKYKSVELFKILDDLTESYSRVLIPVAIFKIDIEEFADRPITDEEFQKFKKYMLEKHEFDIAEETYKLLKDKIWPGFIEENPEFRRKKITKK